MDVKASERRSIRVPRDVHGSQGELFLAFKMPVERMPEARSFRSTWLSSSLLSLREHGDYERYLTLLAPEHREAIVNSVAGQWLSTDVAIAHYVACGELGLSRAEITQRSHEVTRRVHQTMLSIAVRLAREAGVTPWTILGQIDRLWERIWQGGGVSVTKLGPKEAVVTIARWPCAGLPYCRAAMPGVIHAVVEMFCSKAYVVEIKCDRPHETIALRCSWA